MKTHWANQETQGPLCGSKIYGDDWSHSGAPGEVDCKKCKAKMCEDCSGTGIMGGKQAGIYCQCQYGEIRELQAEGLDEYV